MIVLNLSCSKEHLFEGWFASLKDFEAQSKAHLIACPVCGEHTTHKLPSAPYVQRAASAGSAPQVDRAKTLEKAAQHIASVIQANPESAQLLEQLCKSAEKAEDVGEDFSDEARRIHYGQAKERTIRGVATLDETEALLEEGISVLPLPKKKQKDIH